ncbi:ABC transporter ATP-binding protein [Salinicoccus carnicancri]|uniref:ABC transporter ATP-binding protein n=1 Tax=Salinicoccus carnicancri TaxID=558170 RepID=UPI0002EE92AB|nr:ABC transporter ATP-binding protein [Salinicoccus carnicancri]
MKKLIIENLRKRFKKKAVLDDINLQITEGTIHGLIGENGVGKSTLMKVLTNLTKKDNGNIILKGYDEDVSIKGVIEEPSLYPFLNALQHLHYYASLFKYSPSNTEVDRILQLVNLYEERFKKVKNYSLGMKKKLSLAQVFLLSPNILTLDEPFNGLDLKTSIKVKNHLRHMKNNGSIIIISSHILSDMSDICDNVSLLKRGKIVYNHTKNHVYVDKFKMETSQTEETLKILEELYVDYKVDINKITLNCNLKKLSWVLKELDYKTIHLYSLINHKKDLEEMFIEYNHIKDPEK